MTRRLKGGRLGAVYTDSDAVAANRDAAAWGFDINFVPLVVGATPTSHLQTTTPVLVAGIYVLTFVVLIVGSNSGTDVSATIEIDGVALDDVNSEAVVANGGFLLSATLPVDWSSADETHTIESFGWHPAGPGTATVHNTVFTWQRKA